MALPTFVATSVTQSSVNAITNINWPSGHQAGDIGILVIQTSAEAPGVNPPSGFTEVPTVSPQSIGTAATAGSVRLSVFYRIAASNAEPVVDVGDSGDHQITHLTVYRGVDTSAPFDVNAGTTAASSTAVSCPGVTTTGADRLILNIIAHAVDTTTNPLPTPTNAGLANIASRKVSVSNVGTGGGVGTFTGEKATAGATGASTATLTTASAQALVTLSLKPPSSVPFGGLYVATGVKSAAGATGASSATLTTSQVQATITIALKPPTPVTNNPPVLDALPDLFVAVGDLLEFQATATDPEGGAIAWSLTPGTNPVPSGLTIDSLGFIRWTPQVINQGVFNVMVRATDVGGLFDDQAINVTVTGGFASAVEVATRAKADAQAAKALADLLDQQEQMNANVIRKAREVAADLQITSDFMQSVIDDQT